MRQLICILLLFVFHTHVQAKSGRTCRVLFLGAPDNAPKTLHLFDGKASQEVELPSINFSPVYKLPGSALVLRILPAPETDPKKVSPDAPSVEVAADVTEFYLLVSSDPANAVTPVKLEVVDSTKFTKGQMLWFNLTANRLDGQIGTEKLVLDGNSQVILNPPTNKNDDYNVNISFSKPDDDVLQPLCETKWHHDPEIRNVFFVVTNEGARAPRVMGLRDQREAAER